MKLSELIERLTRIYDVHKNDVDVTVMTEHEVDEGRIVQFEADVSGVAAVTGKEGMSRVVVVGQELL